MPISKNILNKMADKDYRVIHRRSVVVENGLPKLPTSAQTEYGEISINYAKDHETLSIRNNQDEIVTFSSDNQIREWIPDIINTEEQYEALTQSGNLIDAYTIKQVIDTNELVTSLALNTLNNKTIELSDSASSLDSRVSALENQTVDLSSVASAVTINNNTYVVSNGGVDLGSGYTTQADFIKTVSDFSGLTESGYVVDGLVLKQVIEDNEIVTSEALNDLNDRATALSSVTSNHETRIHALENGAIDLSSVASAVTINNNTYVVSNGGVNLGSGYTTQADIDNQTIRTVEGFSALTQSGSLVDAYVLRQVIRDNEDVITEIIINESAATISGGSVDLGNYIPMEKEFTIASAFNDLNDRVNELSSNTQNYYTAIEVDDLLSNSDFITSGVVETMLLPYATQVGLSAHTTNTSIHLPAVTSSDNGKILMVVNGQWTLTSPTSLYTGTGIPDDSLGNNGDIYAQTS